jgi:hypothetical protein
MPFREMTAVSPVNRSKNLINKICGQNTDFIKNQINSYIYFSLSLSLAKSQTVSLQLLTAHACVQCQGTSSRISGEEITLRKIFSPSI